MTNENQPDQLWGKCLFTKVFRTFRIAIQPTKLIIALCAVALICLVGVLMDLSQSVVVAPETGIRQSELHVYLESPAQVGDFIDQYKETGERAGVFGTMWHFATTKFHSILAAMFQFNLPEVAKQAAGYFKAVAWAFRFHYVYSILFALTKLAIIAVAGGAICRTAALQFAQEEKPGLSEALRFSIKRFASFFAAPLAPLGIIIVIGIFIFLLGLIANIPYVGELIMAVFFVLVLIAGAIIAAILIGTVAGFNLMFPAVAYDGTDCFDAISRAFSYVYSKPWRMGFYTAIAAVYGSITYLFVRLFAFLLLWSGFCFLGLGLFAESGDQVGKLEVVWSKPAFSNLLGTTDFAASTWTETVAAFVVTAGALVIVGLIVAFIVSFYFSANTIIYALMRNRVDGTDLQEVFTEPAETEQTEQPAEETVSESSEQAQAQQQSTTEERKQQKEPQDESDSQPSDDESDS